MTLNEASCCLGCRMGEVRDPGEDRGRVSSSSVLDSGEKRCCCSAGQEVWVMLVLPWSCSELLVEPTSKSKGELLLNGGEKLTDCWVALNRALTRMSGTEDIQVLYNQRITVQEVSWTSSATLLWHLVQFHTNLLIQSVGASLGGREGDSCLFFFFNLDAGIIFGNFTSKVNLDSGFFLYIMFIFHLVSNTDVRLHCLSSSQSFVLTSRSHCLLS